MRLPKILLYVMVTVILVVPATRERASSIMQSVIIRSGIVNVPTDAIDGKEAFNYDFTIRDLTGKNVDFNDFRGKVIFINLWATWCGPCRSEMPSIQELYNDIDKKKIVFVMLSLDEQSRLEKVKSYVSRMAFSFPIFMTQGQLTSQLYMETIPATFVIDKEGYIVAREIGMRNYNTAKFKRYLENLASK